MKSRVRQNLGGAIVDNYCIVFKDVNGGYFNLRRDDGAYWIYQIRANNVRHLLHMHSSCRVESPDDIKVLELNEITASMPNLRKLIDVVTQLGAFGGMGHLAVTEVRLTKLYNLFGSALPKFWERLEATFNEDGNLVIPKE